MYDIFFPIIEHYTGIRISKVKRIEESILFKTALGQLGKIERNIEGDWDLLLDEEKVAEIEDSLFSIFCEPKNQPPIDKYYNQLLGLKKKGVLNYKSNVLVDQLITSIEFLILHMDVQLEDPIAMGPFFTFNHNGTKHVLVLN
jgi:hypothetical protein